MATPDFYGMLSSLGDTLQQNQRTNARQRTLAELGQGGGPIDYNEAARRLLPVDPQMAMTLASLGRSDRSFDFQQQEAQRAQGNTDRSFALQKQTADEAARGVDYREIDDGNGGKVLVKIHKATGQIEKPSIEGVSGQPSNPYAQGKMNEAQSKDGLYAGRMFASEKVLRDVENIGTSVKERVRGVVSEHVGFNLRGPEFQKFDQAQRDFINATLRRESGAVISPAEFDNANKQYFPKPGDTTDVISQKRANRAEAIRGIASGAGPSWRPDHVFSPDGAIVDNPAPKRNAPAKAAATTMPKPGEVRDGYRYKGGPPGDQSSWVKLP